MRRDGVRTLDPVPALVAGTGPNMSYLFFFSAWASKAIVSGDCLSAATIA